MFEYSFTNNKNYRMQWLTILNDTAQVALGTALAQGFLNNLFLVVFYLLLVVTCWHYSFEISKLK
jgi:hypothetical protein